MTLRKTEIGPPRKSTMNAIAAEVERARRMFLTNEGLKTKLMEYAAVASMTLSAHDNLNCRPAAIAVYMEFVKVAALAIRLLEEGDAAHCYLYYVGQPMSGDVEDLFNSERVAPCDDAEFGMKP